jgi:hypothetical protein
MDATEPPHAVPIGNADYDVVPTLPQPAPRFFANAEHEPIFGVKRELIHEIQGHCS